MNAEIKAPDGGSFGAYLALPPGNRLAPALVVAIEIRGLNANMRAICDDYAARGYIAVCPDLLWRIEPGLDYDPDTKEGWEKAMAINAAFDEAKAVDDLKATLDWVRQQPRSNGTAGVLGFCLGGKLAYLMATRSDAQASVGYYGIGIDKTLGEADAITRPLMLHIAGEDRFVPPEAQRKISGRLATIEGAEAHIYPGADHAFARKDGVRFLAEAAALADARTVGFLDRWLKG
ncbi:MAG TPA: dienelactone hydrolase family protein [Alphaproteobacteria bacterium]|jgi:carboxymethylenebutenolidase|nr:dienelactone hydrolase family protein [Alphaproteobacteria bacterium]